MNTKPQIYYLPVLVLLFTFCTSPVYAQYLAINAGPGFPAGKYGSEDFTDEKAGLATAYNLLKEKLIIACIAILQTLFIFDLTIQNKRTNPIDITLH